MNRILIIDPGKGWGQFVSKMYCFQKLAEYQNSKIIFLTKRSTQAEYYLRDTTFCDEVIYLNEPRKGIKNTINNIKSLLENINKINKFEALHFTVGNSVIWGLQYHPEIPYDYMIKLIKHRSQKLINNKSFKNETEINQHISLIEKAKVQLKDDIRLLELKNWLNYLKT